jgi:phosphatidylglycerophosphatase A
MSKSQSDNLSFQKVYRQSDFSGKTALTLSSWFGTGRVPVASGTFGTLGAIPLILLLDHLGAWYRTLILVVVVVIAIWTAGRSQDLLGRNDPSEVVIDEVAGFLLTLFLLPCSWLSLCSGFILFRLFDILKPYPVRQSESLSGGFGIVIDDLLAGLYAHLGVRILLFFIQ